MWQIDPAHPVPEIIRHPLHPAKFRAKFWFVDPDDNKLSPPSITDPATGTVVFSMGGGTAVVVDNFTDVEQLAKYAADWMRQYNKVAAQVVAPIDPSAFAVKVSTLLNPPATEPDPDAEKYDVVGKVNAAVQDAQRLVDAKVDGADALLAAAQEAQKKGTALLLDIVQAKVSEAAAAVDAVVQSAVALER